MAITEKQREYNAQHYQKNKESILAKRHEYKKQNPEDIKVKYAKFYQENRENILAKRRERRKRNPEKYKEINKKSQQKRKRWSQNFANRVKTKFGCSQCGEKYPKALDFHHIRGSKFHSISFLCLKGYTMKVIKDEMRKCVILCANCHRKQHYTGRRGTLKRQHVTNVKKQSSCKCGEVDFRCLDFHHLRDKVAAVAEMAALNLKLYSLEDLKQEIEKCIVLCANCHRKHHD